VLPEAVVIVAPTGMQVLPDLFGICHPGAGAVWLLARTLDGFNASGEVSPI